MRLGSLFAGIGGFELAATWAGITPVWSNEIEPFACKVLTKNFDHEIIQKDIREIGKHNLPAVDIISGGFPCQPFSQAGKRKGTEDNRYLWPEMLRIIRELQPSWVIGENVAGLLSMERGATLKRILADLEAEGYNNEVFSIPACGKGAWHKRERIWICANSIDRTDRANGSEGRKKNRVQEKRGQTGHPRMSSGADSEIQSSTTNTMHHGNEQRREGSRQRKAESKPKEPQGGPQYTEQPNELYKSGSTKSQDATNTNTERSQGNGQRREDKGWTNTKGYIRQNSGAREYGQTQSGMGRVADGIPPELDGYWNQEPEGVPRVSTGITNRADRLKGLGNAICPQVAYELFKAIHENVQG